MIPMKRPGQDRRSKVAMREVRQPSKAHRGLFGGHLFGQMQRVAVHLPAGILTVTHPLFVRGQYQVRVG